MKMRIKVLITFFVFMLLICGCSKKNANYFHRIEINGRYEIVGKYPVSEEKINNIKCYHFVYGESKKLIKIEYLVKGKLHNSEYDKFAQVLFEYSDEYEKRIFQDSRNRQIENINGVYSIRIKFDKNNYPISLFNYNKNGVLAPDKKGVTQYLWTTNKNGQRINSVKLNIKGDRIEDNDGFYEERWKYDENGNVTEESYYDADEQLKEKEGFAVQRWKYDEQGICIGTTIYNNKTNLIYKSVYLYDENGKHIKTVIYDDKGNFVLQ